jgi:indole-3-acetate monooxygenase
LSAFVSEEGTDRVFSDHNACVVGSVAPLGRAVSTEGGYLVSGRWPFVSGVQQATYTGGVCLVFDGEQQRMTGQGAPVVVIPVWPVTECEIIDVWDTTGLRGTGSNDIAVKELFVPTKMVANLTSPPRPGLTPLHYIDVNNAANMTIASIAIGIASASLEAFRELGARRVLATGETLKDSGLGRAALASAEGTLARARGHLYETVEEMSEAIADQTYRDEDWIARTALVSVATVDAAIDVASQVYRAAGTAAIFRSAIFDRCLRDLYTLGAHKAVQHVNLYLHGGATFN